MNFVSWGGINRWDWGEFSQVDCGRTEGQRSVRLDIPGLLRDSGFLLVARTQDSGGLGVVSGPGRRETMRVNPMPVTG